LVEQIAQVALHVVDYGYVRETGKIELEGPTAQQADNRRAIETYLGLSTKTQTEWS
jgi:branched-chain amino acid transport system ATP-binding protein